MIRNRKDFEFYLSEDRKRFDRVPGAKDYLLSNEIWYIYRYQRHLRYMEYYKNTGRSKFLFLYHFFFYKRLGFKLRFTLYPNTVGPGLRIFPTGDFIHVKRNCTIGSHCTLLPGAVIGNKNLEDDGSIATIGNNIYMGWGQKYSDR